MTPWPWIAAFGAVAGATVIRMRDQLVTDGGIGRGTATVLDALYVAHLSGIVAIGRHDPEQMHPTATPTGVALALSGATMMVTGMRSFPTVSQVNAMDDQQLVTDGIYRYSRNPEYVGWAAVVAGMAMALRSRRALTLAAVYPAVVSWWVRQEERHLEARFGEPYCHYLAATPRWIGRPTPPCRCLSQRELLAFGERRRLDDPCRRTHRPAHEGCVRPALLVNPALKRAAAAR